MRYLFFILLFFTSCINRSGQLTIVRGQVIDELENGAGFKNLSVSSFKDNSGLLEDSDPFFGTSEFTTDSEGNYEFSFFNSFDGEYSLNVRTDSLFKGCISTKIELGTVNQTNYLVQRKSSRLRVNFENLNDTTRYLIQVEDVFGTCNGIFWYDTIQVSENITQKAFLYRTIPNQSVLISVKTDEIEGNFFTPLIDTLITVGGEQINVDFPLF